MNIIEKIQAETDNPAKKVHLIDYALKHNLIEQTTADLLFIDSLYARGADGANAVTHYAAFGLTLHEAQEHIVNMLAFFYRKETSTVRFGDKKEIDQEITSLIKSAILAGIGIPEEILNPGHYVSNFVNFHKNDAKSLMDNNFDNLKIMLALKMQDNLEKKPEQTHKNKI